MGALLWPLFVAACEAVSPEDRELAARAFAATKKRQGMMNIERAWDIVQEVWQRADKFEGGVELEEKDNDEGIGEESNGDNNAKTSYEKEGDTRRRTAGDNAGSPAPADLWRQVSMDMGVNIVFG